MILFEMMNLSSILFKSTNIQQYRWNLRTKMCHFIPDIIRILLFCSHTLQHAWLSTVFELLSPSTRTHCIFHQCIHFYRILSTWNNSNRTHVVHVHEFNWLIGNKQTIHCSPSWIFDDFTLSLYISSSLSIHVPWSKIKTHKFIW